LAGELGLHEIIKLQMPATSNIVNILYLNNMISAVKLEADA